MEPAKFQVKLSDLIYSVRFSRPLFEMVGNLKFFKDLYDSYKKFGLRLQDMKTESPTTNPSDLSVSFRLAGNRLSFITKLDNLEFTGFDPFRLDDRVYITSLDRQNFDVKELMSLGLNCIKRNFDSVEFQFHDFRYKAHCTVEGKHSKEYVQQYLQIIPQGLGEHIGSAVGYYFQDTQEKRVSNVIVDQSSVIKNGIFFTIDILYESDPPQATDVFDQAGKHFNDILAALKIDLAW